MAKPVVRVGEAPVSFERNFSLVAVHIQSKCPVIVELS